MKTVCASGEPWCHVASAAKSRSAMAITSAEDSSAAAGMAGSTLHYRVSTSVTPWISDTSTQDCLEAAMVGNPDTYLGSLPVSDFFLHAGDPTYLHASLLEVILSSPAP